MRSFFHTLFLLVLISTCSVSRAQSIDLAGYWKFDDASGALSAADETGTSNGLVYGSVVLGDAGVNANSSAAAFDQSSTYIEIPHHDDFLLNEGTVVFWFNTTSTSGRQGILSKDSSGKDAGGHLTIYLQGGQLKVRMQSTSTSYDLKSSVNIVKGQWYHVALVFGPGGMELYVNGVLSKAHNYAGGLGVNSVGVGNYEPMVIGAVSWMSGDRVATPVHDHFQGKIDEVAILSNRLSSSTIADIYTQTGGSGSLDLGDLSSPPPVYYVRTNGSDSHDGLSPEKAFRTIQHAVDQCSRAGTTVYVGPGTYTGEVKISGSWNMPRGKGSGTLANPIRLIADTAGEFTLDAPGEVILDGEGTKSKGFEVVEVEHWVIQGFTIRNQKEYGVFVHMGGVSVLHCTIEVPGKFAIYAMSVSDVMVADCSFERAAGSGSMVLITPTDRMYPGRSTITVTRNDMTMKNELYMSTKYERGFRGRNSDQGAQRRVIHHGIIVLSRPLANIETIEISNNQISDTIFSIFSLARQREQVTTIVANNTVVGSYYSVYLWPDRYGRNFIVNNIIDTCYFGAFAYGRRGKSTFTVAGLLENNITVQMARYSRPYEFDVIAGDPRFVDAPAGDFSLRKGSPAIDVGMDLQAPAIDIAGRARPVDGDEDGIVQIDLGVTELVGVASDRVRVVRWREVGGENNR